MTTVQNNWSKIDAFIKAKDSININASFNSTSELKANYSDLVELLTTMDESIYHNLKN